ncbi:MAG: response regulator [Rhodospirillales bacterium]|nr:response regulator [Rhodospirillales bacterium]
MSSRILIVEDDAMIQGFLRLTLENDGYQVSAAQNAAEMRVQFQNGGIDLVLLDLGLPDADGLDLVTEIRSASSLPIIVASARAGSSDRVATLERGANDYLTKPFDPMEMLLRLRNVLNPCAPAPAAHSTGPLQPERRAQPTQPERRAQPAQPAQPAQSVQPPQPAHPAPPVPPALHTPPVSPLPLATPAAPVASPAEPVSAEQSLQAAARKSAPQPISQAPAKASVDKSVIIAGILAVVAFGGAGLYWVTNYMPVTNDENRPARERQIAGQDGAGQTESGTLQRRGVLQPPSEPDVRIAQSSNGAPQGNRDNLTRSVTSLPDQDLPPSATGQRAPVTQASVSATDASPVDGTEWVKNSKCAPLPDVKWWRVKSHLQVVLFVNSEHGGDWQPYLNNWRARVEKLKDISDRGSGIKTSSGEILQNESLAEYIRDTADRISIIQCLAREARIATSGG